MRLLLLNCVVFLAWCPAVYGQPIAIADVERSKPVLFEQDILPILQRSCLACHSASEAQGDLILETPETMLEGGSSGPVIVPGKGAESLLLKQAAHQEESFMPPPDNDVNAATLTSQELGLLRLWIDQGAKGSDMPAPPSPRKWQTLSQGTAPVYAVALSSDGQHVAVTRANQLFVYQVSSGQMLAHLQDTALDSAAHQDLIQSLAWSDDGSLLASGGFREVKLWRKPRAVPLQRFATEKGSAALAVSPDRKLLATSAPEHAIQLWNAETGEPGPKLSGHRAPVTALRFTSDGQRLVSASEDGTIRTWNCEKGAELGALEAPAAALALELVPTAKPQDQQTGSEILVTGGSDKMLRTWTIPQTLPQRLEWGTELAQWSVSDKGEFVAVSDRAGTITVRPASPQASQADPPIAQWKPESGAADHLLFVDSPPGGMLVTETKGQFSLWKLPEHQLVAQWSGEPVAATDPAPTDAETADSKTAAPATTALAASADGTLLGSGMSDGRILLWGLAAQESDAERFLRPMEKMDQPITALRFSSDGKSLFATDKKGTLRGFATTDGKLLFDASHGAAIQDLAISPNQQVLATAGEDAVVRLWQPNGQAYGPQQLTGLSGPATRICFSGDGTRVIVGTGGEAPRVEVFDLKSGIPLQRFSAHEQPVLGLICQSDQVVSASADGVWQWSLYGLQPIPGHEAAITSLVSVPDQSMQVFSGSLDGTIRRWNLAAQEQLAKWDHGGPVLDMDVRSDGQRLASVSDNHTAKLWDAAGKQISEMKGDILARNRAARTTRELNAANQKRDLLKQRVAGAEEILTARIAAEKEAAEGVATMKEEVAKTKLALEQANAKGEAKEAAEGEETTSDVQQAFEDAEAAQTLAMQKQAAAIAAVKTAQTRVAETKQLVSAAEANVTRLQAALELANRQVSESERPVRAVRFAPNGKVVATAGDFLSIHTWDAESGAALDAIPGQAAPLYSLAFVDDGRLASASTEPEAVVWELDPQWRLERTIGSADEPDLIAGRVTSVDFNLTASQLLVGGGIPSRSGELSLFDVAKGSRIHFLPKAHSDVVYAAKFSPDGTQFVSAGADQHVRIWDLHTDSPLKQFEGHTDYVLGVAWKEDAQGIVSGSADQTLKVWNVETADQQRTIPSFGKDVTSVAYVEASSQVVSSCGDGIVRLHDSTNGRAIRTFGAGVWLHCVDATPDGKLVVAGSDDGRLFLWDGSNGKQLHKITVGQ